MRWLAGIAVLLGACAGGQDFSSSTAQLGDFGPGTTGGEGDGPSSADEEGDASMESTSVPDDGSSTAVAEASGSSGPNGGCGGDSECDDGNACTSDVCMPDGTCGYADITASCDDLDTCTDDACDPVAGCINTPVEPRGSETFDFTGAVDTFVVPDCVELITVEAYGAEGGFGTSAGGLGGFAQADVPVTAGESLEVRVGGAGTTVVNAATGGYNGGGGSIDAVAQGTGDSGTGGGASDLRRGSDLGDRLIVAGGGGGGGWSNHNGFGGGGGGLSGEDGNSDTFDREPGGGGTQSAGGSVGWAEGSYTNEPGSFGEGGTAYHDGAGCGGGGGGWYGGGTGGFAGGGGGSSYVDATGNLNTSTMTGVRSGHGAITISW